MADASRSSAQSAESRGRRRKARYGNTSRQPYQWLGVGAITLGLGAAMASGTGIADAKGGDGSSGSSSSSSAGAHTHSSDGKARGHQRPASGKSGSDAGSPTAATPSGSTASADGAQTSDAPQDTNTKRGKSKKADHSQSASTTTGKKAKPSAANASEATGATADDATSPDTAATPGTPPATPAAHVAKTPTVAPQVQPVAAAAMAPKALAADDDVTPVTPAATQPHATSSNPIVAAIQNVIISFFTAPATVAFLDANGLNAPTAPLLNPIAGLVWGVFRNIEDFAGLVPKVGTPTTTSDPATGTVTGTLGFTVPAGGDLTYSVATNPLFGSVTVDATGTYTYKSNIFGSALAALGLNPMDSFTVTASNGVAATNETVTVPVTSAIDTPSTPSASNISVNPVTGVVTGIVSATDPGGQSLTYDIFTGPVGGTLAIDHTTGAFTYTPDTATRIVAETGIATDIFSITASNGNFTSLPGLITVPVSPLSNAAPSTPTVVNQQVNSVTGVVTGTLTATDPSGAPLTYHVTTPPVGGTLDYNSTTGDFTYTPSAAARIVAITGLATDIFTVTASDGTYTSLPAVITVPVTPATSATPGAVTVVNQQVNSVTGVVTGTLTATDPSGAPLTYHVTTPPVGGTLDYNSTTGDFTYTPSAAARIVAITGLATDIFTVTASDGTYTSLPAVITVPVTPATSATPSTPSAGPLNQNVYSGVVTGTLSATSPDGSAVTYHVVTGPAGGSLDFNSTTGAFTYTPSTAARTVAITGLATDAFTVTATSASGYTSLPGIITVPVSPLTNDMPSTPNATINQNVASGVVTGVISATSPDGGAVTYAVLTNPVGGSVTINSTTGAYTYTPTAAARTIANTGIDTDVFTVTATNSVGNTSAAVITVPISHATNDTPSGSVSKSYSGGKTTGTITGTSPDGSAVTYTATATPGSITLNSTTGVFTVNHPGVFGVYSPVVVVFTIKNSSGYFTVITMTFTT